MPNKIRANEETIRSLLQNRKYAIDYYQREYRWGKRQVQELIEDLSEKFNDSYDETHSQQEVKSYDPYFMGSIIICEKKEERAVTSYIVDGQQRLTTLTLLLIFLHHQAKLKGADGDLIPLINSKSFGEVSFNLNIEERKKAMEALLDEDEYDSSDEKLSSLKNLGARYEDIKDLLPQNIDEKAFPHFTDWLLEKVIITKITAESDDDAYAVFETMNDRGLSLTNTEMLKGYLLANIKEKKLRDEANGCWKQNIQELENIEGQLDARCITAWLRGQYAEKIRGTSKGDTSEDFELIATQFHRWVRDRKDELGLVDSQSFSEFITTDFQFYSEWYQKIYELAYINYDPDFIAIYSNAWLDCTLQFPVMLASINPRDREDEIRRKLRLVSTYIDILLVRRCWNGKGISTNSLQYHLFSSVIRKIRGKPTEEIADTLQANLNAKDNEIMIPPFKNGDLEYWHNRRKIHLILARITDYIEQQSQQPATDKFSDYLNMTVRGKNRFQIEHILPDKPQFENIRWWIGALLLLPAKTNASLSDKSYKGKKKAYLKENLLAQSLHEDAYENKPGFSQFIEKSGLPFKSYDDFTNDAMEERCDLYFKIAKQVWGPEQLNKIAKVEE